MIAKPNLKNYTSSVPVINSVSKIEGKLVQVGSKHISKEYGDENEIPIGMKFELMHNEKSMVFQLPANVDKVFDYMVKARKQTPTTAQRESIRLQAQRSAWKILSDLVDIQVSMILVDQAEPMEMFMAYLYDGAKKQTLYHSLKENNFKQLT